MVVLNHNSAVYVAFAKFSEPKEFVRLLKKVEEKVYSRTTTKLIPLLQPEHGFIRQNGPKRFQVQDWYPNKKMVVVSACLNGGCCFSACIGVASS